MIALDKLWELIDKNVDMVPASRGWHHTNCKVCNDHGKKGKRGGFKRDDSSVGYNCFNCGASFRCSLDTDKGLSYNARKILLSFGIPLSDINEVSFLMMGDGESSRPSPSSQKKKITTPDLTFPSGFVSVSSLPEQHPFKVAIEKHLQTKRQMSIGSYPFYVCLNEKNEEWYGRLVIPIYNKGKLIYYQGYDMFGVRTAKYKSVSAPSDSVLYGLERLYEQSKMPLFICEGFFDAFHLHGVAVLGKKLSDNQIEMLNRSSRVKVVVPDKTGGGEALAKRGLREHWQCAFPSIGSCTDVNDAVVKYGKPYVIDSILNNICSGALAECRLQVWRS